MNRPTERFFDRVSNYVKYRPSYPIEVVDTLISRCHLDNQSTVADIGSGTGIFSKLLLDNRIQVIGVEPNEEMRKAAECQLSEYKNFSSVDGQSEFTNLADSSIDLITAAQAFHWFDRFETKKEFERILKSEGNVALIWNQRKIDLPFQKEYDQALREYATDYNSVNHMNITDENIEDFFYPGKIAKFKFDNSQRFDLTGLMGRMQSSSYTPKINTTEHELLMKVVESLFKKHACNGAITFQYDTCLYLGRLSS